MLKKCFGIISWLPDKEPDRSLRSERVNRLFKQLNDLWPDIDILVIAQNWRDFQPIKTKNKQIIKEYPGLGILKARQVLREEFLKLDYDYIIMFDDDAMIKCDNEHAHIDFMNEIDEHPNGFCFIRPSGGMRGTNHKYHPYIGAQLNLCAISRLIYKAEPIPDIDPQKREGFEDSIYSCLLHHKYEQYEFIAPDTIRHNQWMNPNEEAPSTWTTEAKSKGNFSKMVSNTHRIQEYIVKYKDMPKNYRDYIIVDDQKDKSKTIDGRRHKTYLYF